MVNYDLKRVDLTNNRYDKLLVKKMIYKPDSKGKIRSYCECQCDCGNTVTVLSDNIKRKTRHSCGCDKRERIIDSCGRNINGQRFGNLIVEETLWEESPPKVRCKCDCGNTVILRKSDVQSLHTRSCGCLWNKAITESNEKDWTNYVSDYGVIIKERSFKNMAGQWIWKCICPLCLNEFECLPAKILNGHTTSCGCKKSSSMEKYISKILDDNSIKYIEQYSFDDCVYKNKLKFDFAIFNKKDELTCLIEYDGKQHYEPIEYFGGETAFQNQLVRDGIKTKYCLDNKIKLLRLNFEMNNNKIMEEITNII